MPGRLVLAALAAALVICAPAAARPATIPALREWHPAQGAFVLRDSARIVVPAGGPLAEARLLAADLGRRHPVLAGAVAQPGDIELALGAPDRKLGREGYRLEVGSVLRIEARTAAGAFYGTRSVVQLLRRKRSIPAGTARDWPRYPERGLMLDNGRRYFSPRWLRARIRELADLKLNQLHLHFSDDQGFRIESRSHPEIVSDRHLTKRQVRSLLAYAGARHIRVIPEIDMPGHMGAALAAHPGLQLANPGKRELTRLDVTKPAARRFARDLILEYLDLFPGRYWHGGADEYLLPKDYALYPQLERYARARHGAGANGADAYLDFVNWMDRLVRSRGRTLRVWNDGLSDGRAVRLRSRRGGGLVGRSHRSGTARAAQGRAPHPERRMVAHLLRGGSARRPPRLHADRLRGLGGQPLPRPRVRPRAAGHPARGAAARPAPQSRLGAACLERRSRRRDRCPDGAGHRAEVARPRSEDVGLAVAGAAIQRLPAPGQ